MSDCVPWGPRALHHTLVHRDRIWVMGGQTLPQFVPTGAERAAPQRCLEFTRRNRLDQVTECASWVAAAYIGGSAVLSDRMWILGGGVYDTPTTPERRFFSDVWSSADGEHWTQHTDRAAWEPRQYHDVAVFDGRMWVLEGYVPSPSDQWPGIGMTSGTPRMASTGMSCRIHRGRRGTPPVSLCRIARSGLSRATT